MSERTGPGPRRVLGSLTVVAAVVVAVLVLDDNPEPAAEAPAASEAPRAVSAEEFCTAFRTVNLAHGTNLTSPSRETTQQLKDAAAALADLIDGTDMSDRAKEGARFVTELFLGLDDVATVGEIDTFDQQASLQDTANAKALGEYVADNCVARPEPSDPK
jgi:hypothetical protein